MLKLLENWQRCNNRNGGPLPFDALLMTSVGSALLEDLALWPVLT